MKKQSFRVLFIASMIPWLFWLGCNSKANELQTEAEILVKTAAVQQQEITLPVHTSGKLSSKSEMKLSFKVGGIIKNIFVDEGQTVKKGQLLAKLDLSEINARVTQARSGFDKAKRDLERVKQLYADSVATLEQMQDATTGFEIANSNLNVAEFNLQHSAIYAPDDGKILKRFVETNELVGAGHPVFMFGSSSTDWIVRVGVSDRDILRLQLGDSAIVAFDAYPNVTLPARVSEIAEAADPMSGTFEVELKITEGNYKLISGFFAKVDIIPSVKQLSFIIPIEAFVEGDAHRGFVYTLQKDRSKVRKIPVEVGVIFEESLAIVSGLDNVSLVITEGTPYLTEESAVKIINE